MKPPYSHLVPNSVIAEHKLVRHMSKVIAVMQDRQYYRLRISPWSFFAETSQTCCKAHPTRHPPIFYTMHFLCAPNTPSTPIHLQLFFNGYMGEVQEQGEQRYRCEYHRCHICKQSRDQGWPICGTWWCPQSDWCYEAWRYNGWFFVLFICICSMFWVA